MMRLIRLLVVFVVPVLAIFGSQAFSSRAYSPVIDIPIPGGVASNDIFWADAVLGRAYLSDRTNAGIDVFDTRNNTFLGKIPAGGVGTSTAPNGVATDAASNLVFAGLGAAGAGGGFLVADATTLSVNTIIPIPAPFGGPATGRSDELAVAPGLHLVLIANDQDSPPFVTEIAYTAGGNPAIVGQVSFPTQQGCGIEQPVWVPSLQQFYVALPTAGGCPGGIAIFNPTPFSLFRTISTDCSPQGLALGPSGLLFVGCSPAPEVLRLSGSKVATLGTQPSSDEVWFDPGANAYEFLVGAPTNTLNIYSAASNTLFEIDPIGSPFHNLTADATSRNILVALDRGNPNCTNGCTAVFSPPPGAFTAPAVSSASNLGVTCGGIFYPSGTFCGNTVNTGGPVNNGTTSNVGSIGLPFPSSLGVTCGGIFYPSGTFCGNTGTR
jgi:hypothetical protein